MYFPLLQMNPFSVCKVSQKSSFIKYIELFSSARTHKQMQKKKKSAGFGKVNLRDVALLDYAGKYPCASGNHRKSIYESPSKEVSLGRCGVMFWSICH